MDLAVVGPFPARGRADFGELDQAPAGGRTWHSSWRRDTASERRGIP
jgi:hypothetical protein